MTIPDQEYNLWPLGAPEDWGKEKLETEGSVSTPSSMSGYRNNVYTLLSLDNPEVYRDLAPAEELPLFVGEELPI